MSRRIERAAVLGSGVMGAQIAAHLANAGIDVYLLDMVPAGLTEEERSRGLTLDSLEVRNRIVRQGLERAKKVKPPAFFVPEAAELITVGNFEDHLDRLQNVDWIIEAVVENLSIKQSLYRRIEPHRTPGTVVTSNTSGIPIAQLAEGLSDDFRRHFFGTHFFNPPRYLKLLELIPTAETSPEAVGLIAEFADKALGKGVVYAKDTPNFIANRIGTFSMLTTIKVMIEDGYTIEEVDALTGPIIGHPKSASFRTADIAGVDTFAYVVENLYPAVPDDEQRDLFVVPEFIREMLRRGWVGEKAGQGFYKKDRATGEIFALDYKTFEYRTREKVRFPSFDLARTIENSRERLKVLLASKDRAGEFLWKTMSETLIYSANRIPEIADDVVQVDNAMKWGYLWEHGPFETWDAIGVEAAAKRIESEGRSVPALVENLLSSGKKSFYQKKGGQVHYFDLKTQEYEPVAERPDVIVLASLRDRGKVIKTNPGASLIDLGDGVACLEFHSKMNAVGGDTVEMMNYAVRRVSQEFEGLVIGNQGENFSVGANLVLMLLAAQDGEWDEIDLAIRTFQTANLSLRYSDKPVVAAPFGLTLGGGCEITLHADRVRAAAETYIGLVETGVGLVPGGGGTKEFLVRHVDCAPRGDDVDLLPYVKQAFETIAMAKVAGSAVEAKKLGFLRDSDKITMNKDRLIEDAKQTVLAMVREGYEKPRPRTEIPVLGEPGYATLKLGVHLAMRAGYISEYDAHIGRKLAWIVCGGDLKSPQKVSEQYLLDLEREAFLSLLGERKTHERIQYMLREGKPLRN